MTIRLTRSQLIAMGPCNLREHLKLFQHRDSLSVMEALEAGVSISDMLWVAGRLALKSECVRFSIQVSQRVAHLNLHPAVQTALDAAQAWLDNPTDSNRLAAWSAAEAAWSAAEAAAKATRAAWAAEATWAARAAAEAAWAAWAAEAAEAAWFTAGAAKAATWAAWAKELETQKKIFTEIFN